MRPKDIDCFSQAEVRQIFCVGERTLYTWRKDGLICPISPTAHHPYYSYNEIDRFIGLEYLNFEVRPTLSAILNGEIRLATTLQVAKRVGMVPRTVVRAIHDGKAAAIRLGNHLWRVDMMDVERRQAVLNAKN